jgi:hypothetical protein
MPSVCGHSKHFYVTGTKFELLFDLGTFLFACWKTLVQPGFSSSQLANYHDHGPGFLH